MIAADWSDGVDIYDHEEIFIVWIMYKYADTRQDSYNIKIAAEALKEPGLLFRLPREHNARRYIIDISRLVFENGFDTCPRELQYSRDMISRVVNICGICIV